MASFNFNSMVRSALTGGIDFGGDSFKMLLVDTALTETEKDAWEDRADVTGEVSGTGYTAGGKACTLTVAATDDANNDVEITIDPVSWASSTITAAAAVVYKDSGSAATDLLICTIDFGGDVTSTNGTFTVTPSGSLKFQN